MAKTSYLPSLLTRKRRQAQPEEAKQAKPQPDEPEGQEEVVKAVKEPQGHGGHGGHGGHLLGSALKSLLKRFDSKALGVKITLGETRLDAFHGRIFIDGLTIANPEGFNSEYLLRAGRFVLDLDMRTLLKSMGKKVELEEVLLEDVDVIYEKSWSTSNVNEVLKKLHLKVEADAPILHKVSMRNIGAKAITSLGDMGPRLALSDIVYEDFNKEVGVKSAMDGIALVFETLLKSIVASMLGRDTCKSTWDLLGRGKSRWAALMSQLRMCCCSSEVVESELVVQ